MEILLDINGDNIDYGGWLKTALGNYDLSVTEARLIRHNENITSEIFAKEGHFVLRIRKPREGFSIGVIRQGIGSAELLISEVNLLQYMTKHSDLQLQQPVKTIKGEYICDVFGYPACLLSYIDGVTLSKENVEAYADRLGILASELHSATYGFDGKRYVYSHRLLSVLKAELSAALDASHIKADECSDCIRALDAADKVMTRLDNVTGISLLHCDLGMGNILLTSKGLTAIDFSLCGYGYRAMECGMLASNFSTDEAIEAMRLSYNRASGVYVSRYDTDAF